MSRERPCKRTCRSYFTNIDRVLSYICSTDQKSLIMSSDEMENLVNSTRASTRLVLLCPSRNI